MKVSDLLSKIAGLKRASEDLTFALQPALDYLRDHALANLDTGGEHGGGDWDFSTEPKYQARKTALWGASLGRRPLAVDPSVQVLRPALAAGWGLTPQGVTLDVDHPNADALFLTGGVGPYGEPYPARHPVATMTVAQRQELRGLVARGIVRRLQEAL